MKCEHCGVDYPSKHHFETPTCCIQCFRAFDSKRQEEILKIDTVDLSHEGAAAATVNGKRLVCPVCQSTYFWERETLMNTPGMTFFGVEWANKSATNYICNSCGYVFWFLRDRK